MFIKEVILIILGIASLSFFFAFTGLLITKNYITPETCLLLNKSYTPYQCYDSLRIENSRSYYNCGPTQNYKTQYIVLVNNDEYILSNDVLPKCTTICQVSSEIVLERTIYGDDYFIIEPNLDYYNNIDRMFSCYLHAGKNRVVKSNRLQTYNELVIMDTISVIILLITVSIYFNPYKCVKRNRVEDFMTIN